jgi:glycosyltransferase involved in cell wall biosynthesis
LRTGVENSSGGVLVFTDADMTYPAKHVPEMVEKLEEGADMVLGDRISQGSENIPFFNRFGNRLFSYMVSFIGGSEIKDAQTGLRVLRKEDYEKLDVDAESLEFETKMTVRASKLGYRIEEVPIQYRERVGEAKLSPLVDGWRMFASVPKILFKESSPVLKTGIVFSTVFGLLGLYTGLVSVSDWVRTGVVSHEFYPILTALFLIIAFQTFTSLLVAEQQKNRFRRLEEKVLDG